MNDLNTIQINWKPYPKDLDSLTPEQLQEAYNEAQTRTAEAWRKFLNEPSPRKALNLIKLYNREADRRADIHHALILRSSKR